MWTHCPTVGNTGTQIDIVGEQNTPGRDGGSGSGSPTRTGGGGGEASGPAPRADGCMRITAGTSTEVDDMLICPTAPPIAPGIPAVTARDLASFVPARPALRGEPEGVGVVGMPANFVADSATQTLGGTLFGRAVTVRFSPAAYVFDYGDGTTTRSGSGGASWQELGQPQFTATPTSHSYAERGTYVVSVTTEYTAEVDFGLGGWHPVSGVVTSTTGGYPVQIFEVRTALVDRTCAENPAGPGC